MFAANAPIEILYEDEAYVVFNKPAGLLVVPTEKGEQNTLTRLVNHLPEFTRTGRHLFPCHRLDRETSGAIIFAKNKNYQQLMMDLFRKRAVEKKYVAFVHGNLSRPTGEFRKPVRDLYQKRLAQGQPAVTQYKVLKRAKAFSVVEVHPITGRTNQIRFHFSQAGFPLMGDRKFSFPRDYALKFRRTALHAASLQWEHPVTGKLIKVQSDLPQDMKEFLTKNLGRGLF